MVGAGVGTRSGRKSGRDSKKAKLGAQTELDGIEKTTERSYEIQRRWWLRMERPYPSTKRGVYSDASG